MQNKNTLTKRQLAVIDELFSGDCDQQQVLEKYKISKRLYDKWQNNQNFIDEFNRRITNARRQGELIIAKYASLAAAKLVALTESENQETARKVCLDIISARGMTVREQGQADLIEKNYQQLSAETASQLLAALAQVETKTTE